MRRLLGAMSILLVSAAAGEASSLRVSPALLEVRAPAGATVLTLRNDDTRPFHAQVRVFRWTRNAGAERLEPTTGVVASPPILRLAPGTEQVVRIVRVSKASVAAEESYRVVIDELPDPARRKAGTVNFVLRYSVPVFFTTVNAAPAAVTWSSKSAGGALMMTATNTGGTRLRVANLKVIDATGAIVSRRDGLVGYVLPRSFITWQLPGTPLPAGGIKVVADSELGPINAAIRR